MRCTKCGNFLTEHEKNCFECGTQNPIFSGEASPKQNRSCCAEVAENKLCGKIGTVCYGTRWYCSEHGKHERAVPNFEIASEAIKKIKEKLFEGSIRREARFREEIAKNG